MAIIRKSQLDRIEQAHREYLDARDRGDTQAARRADNVMEKAVQNASQEEVRAYWKRRTSYGLPKPKRK